MQCPVDGERLVMTERSGVEIDYCPKCRGVWLDRGELDKIIERSASQSAPAPRQAPVVEQPPAPAQYAPPPPRRDDDWRGDDDDRRRSDDDWRKRKRKSFLDDLFDF